jgi:hypothetical protein
MSFEKLSVADEVDVTVHLISAFLTGDPVLIVALTVN